MPLYNPILVADIRIMNVGSTFDPIPKYTYTLTQGDKLNLSGHDHLAWYIMNVIKSIEIADFRFLL